MNTKNKMTASPNQLALSMTTPITAKTDSAADPADRPTRDDRLAAAHAVLARGLSGVRTDPAAMADFLAFRARFREYSLNNTVLIWLQRPTAQFCMGFRAWQANGRRVRKGERGLTVFAPVVRKATEAEVAAGRDPSDKTVVAFRTAVTFDYEQTEATRDDALVYTPPAARLDAEAPNGLIASLMAVAASIGYAVRDTHLASYADGWCDCRGKTITLQASLAGADRASVLCHELAHALAHDGDRETTRSQKELQAEGAAYVALAALGLDTARASLAYLKGWAGGDDDKLLAELGAIDRIAADLLARVEVTAG
jgi:antirestriction protein ArdC